MGGCRESVHRCGCAPNAGGPSPTRTSRTPADRSTSPTTSKAEARRCARTYAAFVALLEENGPVVVLPEQTRIAFQVRMSFAQLTLRKAWAVGHLVLARRVEDPAFTKVETFSPRNHLHAFRLDGPDEVEKLAAVDAGGLPGRPAGAPQPRAGSALTVSTHDPALSSASSPASSSVSSGVVGWNLAARMSR